MSGVTKNVHIPDFVQSALWSYDIDNIDINEHKSLLIKNVLDHGTKKATDWLRSVYSEEEIRHVIKTTPRSAWGKKSINLWSIVYGVEPENDRRIVE